MRLVVSALLFLAGVPAAAEACAPDEALAEAALELAPEDDLDGQRLADALRRAGSDQLHGWARRFASHEDATRWLRSLDADAPLVCGWAHGESSVLVVAAARAGSLSIEGQSVLAQVTADFREAHLVVRDGEGALHRLALERQRASLEGLLPPLVVQLVATGPRGPRPIAQRRVGQARSTPIVGGGSLAQRLDALRDVHDASPLRPNRLLADAATRHAHAICAAGVAAHSLRRSDPEGRLASQGIRARVVGEAVARIAPGADPLEALGESPGHAAALVDRRFTDVGIGDVHASGRRCVVVALAAWPRYVGR